MNYNRANGLPPRVQSTDKRVRVGRMNDAFGLSDKISFIIRACKEKF